MMKILVIEDDEFFRDAIRDLLERKKYTVFTAYNGKTAKEILSVQSVDIVLSDMNMPGGSGIELLEWSNAFRPVPFIMMTGFSQPFETKTALEKGVKEFITKPFKDVELFVSIVRILGIEHDG